jgi:transcriptional regulator with XRE-family HTH domain
MSIGMKLKTLRGEKSLDEVAGAVGISKSALHMYEKDQRVPRDEIKVRLANFYGTTVGRLFFDQEVHK